LFTIIINLKFQILNQIKLYTIFVNQITIENVKIILLLKLVYIIHLFITKRGLKLSKINSFK